MTKEIPAAESGGRPGGATFAQALELENRCEKYAKALGYLALFVLMAVCLLLVDRLGGLPSDLQRGLRSTGLLARIGLGITLLLAWTSLVSLAWAIYSRKKAVFLTAISLGTLTFPLVAYIVYRDARRICLANREADETLLKTLALRRRSVPTEKERKRRAGQEIAEKGYSWEFPVLCPHCGKAQPGGRNQCAECGSELGAVGKSGR